MNTKRWIAGALATVAVIVGIAIGLRSLLAAESQSTHYAVRGSTLVAGGGPAESAGTSAWSVIGGALSTEPTSSSGKTARPGFLPASDVEQRSTAARPDRWQRYR